MKVLARCEWVSPIQQITTKKGETLNKCEAKFSFADTEYNYNNVIVTPLIGERAEKFSASVRPGENVCLQFYMRTVRTASGRDFNDIVVAHIAKENNHELF